MALREIIMDDDDRIEMCKQRIIKLLSEIQRIDGFRQYEVAAHCRALQLARDRLAQILQRTESEGAA